MASKGRPAKKRSPKPLTISHITRSLFSFFGQGPLGRGTARPVALALQGGGSHGAFTWGVLDRLLEEESLKIEAISGASAGAMNGAALASGYLTGGRDGAKERLDSFWRSVSEIGRMTPVGTAPLAHILGGALAGSSLKLLSQMSSPYQFNPLDLNPLRNLVSELIDFEQLQRSRKLKLFVSATNVHTGGPRLFGNREITSDVLLASACLPTLHRAVEIEGEYYWDGGFTANPPILPLVTKGKTPDILVVHIDTQAQHELPVTVSTIGKRLQAVLNNAPLIREIHLVSELKSAVPPDSELGQRLERLGLHHILPPDPMTRGEGKSKLKTDWQFLTALKELGRASADLWLQNNLRRLGNGRAPSFESQLLDQSEPKRLSA